MLFRNVVLLMIIFFSTKIFSETKQYYCTSADSRFFNLLLNLIGSIHRYNYDDLGEIAVFDLGLTKIEKLILSKIAKVTLHQLDRTNQLILEPVVTAPNGRKVAGAFSWKPVAIKQSLEIFPYVLYLDAGLSVMDHLGDIFDYIIENKYFFISSGPHNIADRITNYVVENLLEKDFPLLKEFVLKETTKSMLAGVQGVSKDLYNSYVAPMYEYSKDFYLFHDDKTAKLGWGEARHDQSVFSIVMYANDYKLLDYINGYIELHFKNGSKKKVCCSDSFNRNGPTHILVSQAGMSYEGGFRKHLKFKD